MSEPKLLRQARRLGTVKRIAKNDSWGAAGSAARGAVRRELRQLGVRLRGAEVAAADRVASTEWTNRFFWKGPGPKPQWEDVVVRMRGLHESDDATLADFVRASLEHSRDPLVIAGLAQHPLSLESVRSWLETTDVRDNAALIQRLTRSRLLGAAFVGAARQLLGGPSGDEFGGRVEDLYQIPDSRLHQFADSMGLRLHQQPSADTDVLNRLVIVDQLEEIDTAALLLPGAKKTTVLATSDTFGRADLSEFESWPGVGDVSVEHIRTRIPRFSEAYIEIHRATARAASIAVGELLTIPGLVSHDIRQSLEVCVADLLFFHALKIRAVEQLLADPTIDEIVIATDGLERSREFVSMLSGVDGLIDDPRVELRSLANSAFERSRFWSVVDDLQTPFESTGSPARTVPVSLILRKLDSYARFLTSEMDPLHKGSLASVLFVTAGNEAYDDSTAEYVRELRSDFDVTMLHTSGDVEPLVEQLGPDVPGIMRSIMPTADRFNPLADVFEHRLANLALPPATNAAEAAAESALRRAARRVLRDAVGPTVVRDRVLDQVLGAACRAGNGPDAVIVSPQRTAWVGLAALVARRHGIPTLAVEPHAQDANYSRYMKVGADYYGVMSDHFRAQTSLTFGIGADRIRTLGSPRQVAPAGYDPLQEQRRERTAFAQRVGFEFSPDSTYLVFFCQPSDWEFVARIWEMILRAADLNQCVVFLKTHPEETLGRSQGYLAVAESLGLSHLVVPLDTDAATAIALGDVVLTAYSAAAFDAVIRQNPVVCVTDGDTAYPVDLPAILGCPLAGSVEQLSSIIGDLRSDPDHIGARAVELLEREDHFVLGPGPRLRAFLSDIIDVGESGIRDERSVPETFFLDEPHPNFAV